jgi:hypothetical protein
MGLLTRHLFQGMGGAKSGNRTPFNRLTTATATASPNGQPQRANPVLDGDFAVLYRYPNRFNRPANRKREGPGHPGPRGKRVSG